MRLVESGLPPINGEKSYWSFRLLPLLFLAVLLGPIPFILNPGLFWDDWVWKYTDPAEHIRIGRQLGIWWAGYLSQLINGSEQTALISRLIAFVGWIAGAGGFSATLFALRVLPARETLFVFLAICSCHLAVIRFVESMAMANAYIGSFWVACAILAHNPARRSWRIVSMSFFLFSFHLNSMLFLYGLPLAALLYRHWRQTEAVRPPSQAPSVSIWRNSSLQRAAFLGALPKLITSFAIRNAGFLSLPFVFILLIKVPSLVLSVFFTDTSRIYSNYNAIDPTAAFSALLGSVKLAKELIFQYLGSLTTMRPVFFIGLLILFSAAMAVLPRSNIAPSRTKCLSLIAAGAVLVVAGIYPYVLVDKPPKPFDFYESRHILVAVPGLVLIWISLIALIPAFAPAKLLPAARWIQSIIVACLLSASTCSLLLQGFDLFKDWMQHDATAQFLRRNRDSFAQYKTFVFDDAGGYRIGNRYIWNYEYTGGLIEVFGGKDRFGLSVQEYSTLPPDVPLLRFKNFRERYNIKDYEFTDPHLFVRIEAKPWRLRIWDTIVVAWIYWTSGTHAEKIADAFTFQVAPEFTEADQRIAEMRPIVSALIKAKRAGGSYPNFWKDGAERKPAMILGEGRIYREINGVRQLGFTLPDQTSLTACADEYRTTAQEEICRAAPRYVYFSDGIDFKLLYVNAKDLPYARQAHGSMIDEKHKGYGIWTSAAAGW